MLSNLIQRKKIAKAKDRLRNDASGSVGEDWAKDTLAVVKDHDRLLADLDRLGQLITDAGNVVGAVSKSGERVRQLLLTIPEVQGPAHRDLGIRFVQDVNAAAALLPRLEKEYRQAVDAVNRMNDKGEVPASPSSREGDGNGA